MDSLQLLTLAQTSTSALDSQTATAWHLEQLTKRISTHINKRDWTHPDWKECLHPEFQAMSMDATHGVEYLGRRQTASRDEYVQQYRAFTEAHPDYQSELISISTTVDGPGNRATVCAVFRVTGDPQDVQRETVVVAEWGRRDGCWTGLRQMSVRGCTLS